MALRKVYNPPPSWPAPPPGWQPPAGWQPDPAWGPAPEGWQFFTLERANPRAWAYGFAAGGALLVVLLAIGTAVAGTLPGPEAFGAIFGRCLTAGLVTAIIAWVSARRWPLWLYPLVALGVGLVLGALVSVGQQNG